MAVQTRTGTLAEAAFSAKGIQVNLVILAVVGILTGTLEALSPASFDLINPLTWQGVVKDGAKDLGIVVGIAVGLAASAHLAAAVLAKIRGAAVSSATHASPSTVVAEATRIATFALLIIFFARISIHFGSNPVPITGSTLAVLVTAAALGARQGTLATIMYLSLGASGLHVFASAGAEFGLVWNLAAGGYIIGFVAAAAVIGFLVERGLDRGPGLLVAMLIGNVVLYVPGLLQLAYWVGWDKTLGFGLYPFIPGDLAKLYVASLVVPSAWALVGMRGGRLTLWR